MNSINITTSQNIDVEYEPGSLGDRVLGRIIDWIVIGAYIAIILAIIGFSNIGDFFDNNGWIIILFILPVFFYDLLCEMLLNGQSVGKKVMGIKVISLNGEQPSFSQYLNRWVFRLVDFTISGSLVAFIMVAVTEKKQRLGDLIAGTTLVKTKPRTEFNETIYDKTEIDYQVTYPEVVNLKDSDVQLIKEVILTVNRTGNTMIALQAQQKVEQSLHIMSGQAEPIAFLNVILADYNFVTSQL